MAAVEAQTVEVFFGVTIFSAPGCPHCKAAKATLDENSIAYRNIDVSNDAVDFFITRFFSHLLLFLFLYNSIFGAK